MVKADAAAVLVLMRKLYQKAWNKFNTENTNKKKICYTGFDHKGLKYSGFHVDMTKIHKTKERMDVVFQLLSHGRNGQGSGGNLLLFCTSF